MALLSDLGSWFNDTFKSKQINQIKPQSTSFLDRVKQVIIPAAQNYVNTYQKVAPYVPFAPQINTPQQIQSNYNKFQASPVVKNVVRPYIQNNIVNPLTKELPQAFGQIPSNIQQRQYGTAIGNLAKGTFAGIKGGVNLLDPVAGLAWNTYEGLKAQSESRNKGQSIPQSLESMRKGFIGEKFTGLGSALQTGKPLETPLNVAEIATPLTMMGYNLIKSVKSMAEYARLSPQEKLAFQSAENTITEMGAPYRGKMEGKGKFELIIADKNTGKVIKTKTYNTTADLRNAMSRAVLKENEIGIPRDITSAESRIKVPKFNQGEKYGIISGTEPPAKGEVNDVGSIINKRIKITEEAMKNEAPSIGQSLKRKWMVFKEKLVNSSAPITDVLGEAEKKNKIQIRPVTDIRLQLPRVRASDAIADNFATKNGLVDVIKNVDDPAQLSEYLKAKHHLTGDTTAETGLNLNESKKIVQALEQKYAGFASTIRDYTHKLLDYRVQTGLMSQETANVLKKKYPDYIPLTRIFSPDELTAFQGRSKGVASISQTGIKARTGSTRAIQDPLYSLLELTRSTFRSGETNKAASMLSQYEKLPGNPFQLRRVKPSENPAHFVTLFENGRKVKFETTPEVEAVAKNLNAEQMNFIAKIFSYPVRILKTGATGVLNPVFTLANFVKDQATAFVNSDKALSTSMANPVNFLKSTAALTGRTKEYDLMLEQGLRGGTTFDIYRNDPKLTIEGIRSGRNVLSKIKYVVKNPEQLLRAAEDIVGSTEKLTRNQQFIGTRDALIREGRTVEDANLLAAKAYRENTVDFGQAGSWGRVLNQFIPYFNAGVQGTRTFLSTMKRNPLQASAKIVISAFTPMAAATAWNMSDPKRKQAYDDIQDWEKKNNFILVPPNPVKDDRGGWNVIKIPMSQQVAYLTNFVRRGVEQMYGGDPVKSKELLSTISGTVTPYDVTDPRGIASSLIPQIGKSELEIATNTNLFTGKPVVPDYMKNQPTNEQVYPWTSGTARKIGGAVGLSPITIENAVSTNLGTGGKLLLNTSDKILNKAGVIPESQVGGTDIKQGIDRRFFSAAGGKTLDEVKKEAVKGWDSKTTSAWDFIHSAKTLDENGLPAQDREQSRINAALRIDKPEILRREAMEARTKAALEGTPINPLYNLPYDRQLIALRLSTLLPGDQKSALQKANIDWLKPYWEDVGVYSQQMKALGIYKDNPNYKSPPKASAYAQQQMDLGNWNDPEVQAYLQANTAYKNEILKEAGLPPLPEFGGYSKWPKYKKKITIKKPSLPKVGKISNIRVKTPAKIKLPKQPKSTLSKKSKSIKLTGNLKKLLTSMEKQSNIKIKA